MKYTTYALMIIAVLLSGCEQQRLEDYTRLNSEGSNPIDPLSTVAKKHWQWLDNIPSLTPLTSDADIMRKNYYVVIDGSGSMSGSRMSVAKQAVKAFTSKVAKTDSLGLVAFDKYGTSQRVELQPNNAIIFNTAVDAVTVGGGTPLHSAILTAYDKVALQGKKQKGYGEYHIIIVTDGEAGLTEDPRTIVKNITSISPIEIHTIGFQFNGDHSLNQPGITNYYQADDYNGIMQSFTQILAESDTFDVAEF